jgi:hypothetical protein
MLPIKIIRQSHQINLTDGGRVERLVRVDFNVGDDGPFNVSIPEAEFSADALSAKVRAVADEVEKLRSGLQPPGK